jgi:hypothetical protein
MYNCIIVGSFKNPTRFFFLCLVLN